MSKGVTKKEGKPDLLSGKTCERVLFFLSHAHKSGTSQHLVAAYSNTGFVLLYSKELEGRMCNLNVETVTAHGPVLFWPA